MKLIDADKLRPEMYDAAFIKDSDMQKWDGGCWIRYKMFEKTLEEQDEAIIRCKDCKHRYLITERVGGHNYSYMRCGYENVHTRDAQNDMYYCADAERKEEEC